MDKKLKAKWVKALRSGKYKQQTSGRLKTTHEGYCCLGVLAEVAGKRKCLGDSFIRTGGIGSRYYILPKAVQHNLAALNDDGAPFEMIAGLIHAAL